MRGEGAYIWDDQGNRYLDGLSGLFTVQAGHGRRELAEASSRQAEELANARTEHEDAEREAAATRVQALVRGRAARRRS